MNCIRSLLILGVVTGTTSLCLCQSAEKQLTGWTAYSQTVNISEHTGKEFRYNMMARIEKEDPVSYAGIFVRVDLKDGGRGFFQKTIFLEKITAKWSKLEIKGSIDQNAENVTVGLSVANRGDYYFDNAVLEVKNSDGKWIKLTLNNPGFEDSEAADKWQMGIGNGQFTNPKFFHCAYSNKIFFEGKSSLHVRGDNFLGCNESTGKYVEVNGVKLYYEIYGEGRPLLMVHGASQPMFNFIHQFEVLNKDYQVIYLDSRGRGNSSYDPDVELTYNLQVEDIAGFLDAIEVDSAFLVGWSDGAILGLKTAIKYPGKVSKLVAMAANIFPEGITEESFQRLEHYKKYSDEYAEDKRRVYLDVIHMLQNYPQMKFEELGAIKCKTLIMAGDHDEIKTEHTVGIFNAIPGAQLAILPNETHYFPSENPDLFNAIVLKFLGEN